MKMGMETTTVSNTKAVDKMVNFIQRNWPRMQIITGLVILVLVVMGAGR